MELFKAKNQHLFNTLTRREIEVLTLIAEGCKGTDVSTKLGISQATVQNHRSSIREKLNIKSQNEYIKYALAYDLLTF